MAARMHVIAGLFCACVFNAAHADPIETFYRNATVRIFNWAAAGGEYDIHGKLVSRHLGKHIPGNPVVVHQTMTGGGGIVAANHLYNVAPRDGTSLGVLVATVALSQALGDTNVKYDAAKFNWVGTIAPTQENLVAWSTAPVKRYEDLLTTEFVLGASGAGSTSVISPTVMNALLGTRIKIVPGYPGGSQINLAMERGESMGRWNTWSSWKVTKPDWIAEKKIIFLAQSALKKPADLQDAPLLIDLAKNEDDKKIFALLATSAEMGRPMAASPDAPPDRMKAILAAYRATMKDPEFLKEAAQLKIEVDPLIGDELQALVQRALSTPKQLTERLKGLIK
jgi:tripartite-type tricarboxylate transporter receptor subunit TctC